MTTKIADMIMEAEISGGIGLIIADSAAAGAVAHVLEQGRAQDGEGTPITAFSPCQAFDSTSRARVSSCMH
eukprot:1179731-Prorocentrum_minimum.AAC.3